MAQKSAPPAGTTEAPPPTSWDEQVKQTIAKLHNIYQTYVRPLEDRYKYDLFRPSWFEETILNARPFVTFFGPWSAGKSTFINYLLQSNYLWTGPQPTTAEFTVILYGEEAGALDGRVLVSAKDLPFKGLNEFGESFLENFKGFQAPHDLLKSVMLVDTPGVLESAKEIHQRKYDYIKLSRWFAERSDLIFVMFDPSKLDAGVELRMMFKHAFKGIESKVRIILNKADTVNTQELMRVYGSLFWNLSNMISSTEPPRVYVGSFWDQPYRPGTFSILFSEEKADLIHELTEVIPQQALDKKIASLIKRAKDVFVHAIIIGEMRQDLPMMFGKDKAKKQALEQLHITYEKVGARYKMNHRDFPPVQEYRAFLEKFDLESFPPLQKVDKEGLLSGILNVIQTTLPRMLKPVKNTALADPRNKEARQEMQQRYHQVLAAQMEGKSGIQGSSDLVQSGIRASPLALVNPGASGATILADNAPAAQPTANSNAQMQQMMMMMQMMQQQQQAQQQAPQAQGMNPQQMMMMMQMMQQQQAQQQAPPPPPPPPAPPAAPSPSGSLSQDQMMALLLAQQRSGSFSQQPTAQPVPPPAPAPAPQPQPAAMSQEQMFLMMQMQQQQQQAAAAAPVPAPAPTPAPTSAPALVSDQSAASGTFTQQPPPQPVEPAAQAPAPTAEAPPAAPISLAGLTPEQQMLLLQQLQAMQAANQPRTA